MKTHITNFFRSVFYLYYDGFVNMRVGKTLWILIAVKLFVMFAIVKWLFFPNILQENFKTDTQRSQYILQQLTKEK
ncbi:DUF4492 domain-containing protein [Sulfurimonas sp. SWIR-19]|uniref:DUF4492 domain-containing protein n=1 Tax=Sulfurimonas sp. SWIR-19 TaxID=2878390 RepID=UPI001CF2F00C|nr:DUF4492 domain-containing protein [Sulfurimonas sp. SWIR-19]UCN01192.1 DUF4492 domain-containing protein [Sulfurimonas sp. SWIR-19]